MTAGAEREIIPFESQAAWDAWLGENHGRTAGVWIRVAKKASGIPSVTHAEALDVALCYGWIDGQRDRFDDQWFIQLFTPRRRRSNWSKVNVCKVEKLIEDGRMQPSGLTEVERAKADGRWDRAYDAPSVASVPDDLQAALDANPEAKAFFETLKGNNRFAILYRIQDAKRPETRARRIDQFVTMLNEGRTIY
ncbi:MAG: YdeI/OmpD-associated family protein [Acidimicrobiales bacterium]